MLSLDTSGILAALNARDRHHAAAVEIMRTYDGPFFIPAGVMAEVTYMIEHRLGYRMLDSFLADLEAGAFSLDCGERDLPRIRSLVVRYRNLPLGYADAAVIACAERHQGNVLTYDLRDFSVVAAEGTIRLTSVG